MNPEENTQVVDEALTEESLIEEDSIDGSCSVS